jgi:hypothetical protein
MGAERDLEILERSLIKNATPRNNKNPMQTFT